MNYVKKMCILRQIKQGFSGDGKTLSGLIKIEQYGKNLAVEISVINFAPLVSGEYYCLLSDGKGKTEMLALRGKSVFNILSDLDISSGFCGIICYVKNDVVPVAYGINGNGQYDWRAILNATLPPVFPRKQGQAAQERESSAISAAESTDEKQNDPPRYALNEKTEEEISPPKSGDYDDECVADDNYYQKNHEENGIKNERDLSEKTCENAHDQSADQEPREEEGADLAENVDAQNLLHPFKADSDGYYRSVKAEIDELFSTYPKDKTLEGAFSCSEWVRIKGTAKEPQYLVGVLYDDGQAKYICYALAAENKDQPPEEIKNVCTFVPSSLLNDAEGFFVIFQSATGGECVKPERV